MKMEEGKHENGSIYTPYELRYSYNVLPKKHKKQRLCWVIKTKIVLAESFLKST